jgi:cation diffusion facilitator CzcD-associated flavoprotein CzcO
LTAVVGFVPAALLGKLFTFPDLQQHCGSSRDSSLGLQAYFAEYIRVHELDKHVLFSCKVVSCAQDPESGQWTVLAKDLLSEDEHVVHKLEAQFLVVSSSKSHSITTACPALRF